VNASHIYKLGLGIDAGGTYTDAVIYDMPSQTVVSKAKALSTKWNFTIGIEKTLAQLDLSLLAHIELVALSTTLATNAIVENQGQKVGLLLMPPAGKLNPKDITHEPKAAVSGRLTITGQEIDAVDPLQIRRVARSMVSASGVEVFAVSGYAGCVNPSHEITVKDLIEKETGLMTVCGHELSDLLDYQTRARTAILNARLVPLLTRLLTDLEIVLRERHIDAPVAVVKGDGTLMSSPMAKRRPVETILSGPAASVAGARYLTGLKDAVILDMGGTTTDTATIKNSIPEICESGATVAGLKTHVKAMNIRTEGIGGDSLIEWHKDRFTIGPARVAPVAWLASQAGGIDEILQFFRRNLHRYRSSSRCLQIISLLKEDHHTNLMPTEKQIIELIAERPRSIDELIEQTGLPYAGALGLESLEKRCIIQRCGFTPTDLLHISGRFIHWNREAAKKVGSLFADICRKDLGEMAEKLLKQVGRQLTLELLKTQLEQDRDLAELDQGSICRTLVENMLTGGNPDFTVHIHLHHPVIGIGAPVHFFLPIATACLSTAAVIPENADVANAVGAITSRVMIRRKIDIVSPRPDSYQVVTQAGVRVFNDLDEASSYGEAQLVNQVHGLAAAAGTSASNVDTWHEDRAPAIADGSSIFLGRTIFAQIIGQPDLLLEDFRKPAS
jgi:N-methylhydantoinase A/oxoprolinase/acetone carboxylase beta subunit